MRSVRWTYVAEYECLAVDRIEAKIRVKVRVDAEIAAREMGVLKSCCCQHVVVRINWRKWSRSGKVLSRQLAVRSRTMRCDGGLIDLLISD